jgi:hypothetical protein
MKKPVDPLLFTQKLWRTLERVRNPDSLIAAPPP